MTTDRDSENKSSDLRRLAESVLAEKRRDAVDTSALSPEEVEKVFHDLQVHQIELEMQNEELRQSQIQLEELKDRYLDLYDFAPMGYITLNHKGLVVEANLTVCRLLGVDRRSLINRPFQRFVCRDDQDNYYLFERELFETKAPKTCEVQLVKKDSEPIHAQLNTSVRRYSEEATECYRISIVDLTERKQAESSLRESHERYRSVFENAPVGIFHSTRDGKFIDVNPQLALILGYDSQSELIAHVNQTSIAQALYVDPERRAALVDKVTEGEGRWLEVENLYRRKNGEIIVGRLYFRNLPARGDRLEGFVEDFTERKKAEEELLEARQEWRDIFQAIGHPTIIMDVEHGIVSANKAAIEVSGKSIKELLGTKCYEIFHANNAPPHCCPMESLLESGSLETVEMEMEALGGYYLVSCTPVLDAEGRMQKIIHIATDITQRKKAEVALRESEERYRSLFEESIAPILVTDVNGTIVDVNRACEDLFAYTTEELLGSNVQALYADPADGFRFRHDIERVGFVRDYPQTYRRKDGTQIECITQASVRKSEDGKALSYRGTLRDVTHEKALQRQLLEAQKMEAVGTLAGGVAHDFNNLLQIISGHAELLEMELTQRGMRFAKMDAIRHAADRGADLVKQILTFSRRVDTKLESIDLNDDVKNAERLLYRTIPKMIEIELKLEEQLKPVEADSTHIEQLLINLAVNAKDAMPDGGKLTFETLNVNLAEQQWSGNPKLPSGEHVLVRVSDTGQGMSEDVLQHIFEPFFTTKGLAEGTGLGLATVFGIVKLHGGHISCESEVGKGTTFSMYFPVAEATKPDVDPKHKDTDVPRGTETILVVDDEPLIADLAKQILENAGYSVITASSGKEALDVYSQQESDIALVILDLVMTQMGGEECLKELLKINPQVKALIASGLDIKGDTKTFLDKEAKGKVAKPFNMRDLLRSVRHVLDGA